METLVKGIKETERGELMRRGSTGSIDRKGSVDEVAKRKRVMTEEEKREMEEIIKKSKKLERSPVKGRGGEGMKEGFEGLREELKEGWRVMREEIKELVKGQTEELGRLREDIRVREERWAKERERLEEKIGKLEKEVEGLKMRDERGREGREEENIRRSGIAGGERKGWEVRIRRLEMQEEMKERESRRRNIMIKGLKEGEGGIEKDVEEIWKKLGVEVKMEGIKRIEAGRTERGCMIRVRVGSEEEKRRIWKNKGKLRGGEVWLEDDLTWEQRRIRGKLRQIAWREAREGRKVKVEQGRLWSEGKWWRWDEEEDELRDGEGRRWTQAVGQGERQRIKGDREGREKVVQEKGE